MLPITSQRRSWGGHLASHRVTRGGQGEILPIFRMRMGAASLLQAEQAHHLLTGTSRQKSWAQLMVCCSRHGGGLQELGQCPGTQALLRESHRTPQNGKSSQQTGWKHPLLPLPPPAPGRGDRGLGSPRAGSGRGASSMSSVPLWKALRSREGEWAEGA